MTNQENENTTQQNINSEDFETMLDESMKNLNTKIKKGDVVTGTVSGINESHIIISLGVKQDAYAEIGDYMEKGNVPYQIGDEIKGFIVKMDDNQIVVSKSLNRSHGNKVLIKEAFEKQIPVKGKVLGTVKGGYSVDVFGIKAFCPISQIDLNLTEKPEFYINNTFDFEIIENSKGNVIVSRKNILAKDYQEKRDKFFATVKMGDVVKGTVARLTNFGAFVDIGGFEALLHISELSWDHVKKAEDILKVGEEIEVKIIKMEEDKISLSMRALTENPLILAFQKLHVGDNVKCTVIRHENFGSFVEIEKGVEALIPLSLMSNKRIKSPSEVLSIGDEIEAKIVKLDEKNHKISLSLKDDAVSTWDTDCADLRQGQVLMGIIENVSEHGAFVKVNNTITGLVPISKLKKAKLELTNDNVGQELEVRIANINAQAQRLSLEPASLPEFDPSKNEPRDNQASRPRRDNKDNKTNRENRRSNKDHTQDNDWQKYATNYQSVPEDNPFNKL